ncbi:hypothetical protein [Streptomyces lavendulae]|uniref:hypothetical protein n=1 Tax=Streptomyces lavendulae TaxID=1914 RepID=UPI0036EE230B
MGFQTACAILQLIRTPEEYPDAAAFRVEGADEAIDFEVRDAQGRPLLLAQAKTRVEPGSWSATELVRLARRWGLQIPAARQCFGSSQMPPCTRRGRRCGTRWPELEL